MKPVIVKTNFFSICLISSNMMFLLKRESTLLILTETELATHGIFVECKFTWLEDIVDPFGTISAQDDLLVSLK